MMEDASHGAYPGYQTLSDGSMPVWNDSMYTKLICVSAGVGDLAGQVMVGEETKFCCIQSQLLAKNTDVCRVS